MNFLEWIEKRPGRLIGPSEHSLDRMRRTAKKYGADAAMWIAADVKVRRVYALAVRRMKMVGKVYPIAFEDFVNGKRLRRRLPARRKP